MKDTIINGTGNSRYLKSAISEATTWEQFKALLLAGTLPIDLNGINPSGFQQLGDALNKANLMTDETEVKIFGDNQNRTVNDALSELNGIAFRVGDKIATLRNDLGSFYLQCDGGELDVDAYPDLASLIEASVISLENPVEVTSSSLEIHSIHYIDGNYIILYESGTVAKMLHATSLSGPWTAHEFYAYGGPHNMRQLTKSSDGTYIIPVVDYGENAYIAHCDTLFGIYTVSRLTSSNYVGAISNIQFDGTHYGCLYLHRSDDVLCLRVGTSIADLDSTAIAEFDHYDLLDVWKANNLVYDGTYYSFVRNKSNVVYLNYSTVLNNSSWSTYAFTIPGDEVYCYEYVNNKHVLATDTHIYMIDSLTQEGTSYELATLVPNLSNIEFRSVVGVSDGFIFSSEHDSATNIYHVMFDTINNEWFELNSTITNDFATNIIVGEGGVPMFATQYNTEGVNVYKMTSNKIRPKFLPTDTTDKGNVFIRAKQF